MIEKWRSFVAVTPGNDVHSRFNQLIRKLDPACAQAGQKVRWVHPSKLHLTLRFLGDVQVPLASSLKDDCQELDSVRRFSIRFAGLGAFPDPARPRVVFASVEDPDGGLPVLHDRLSSILEQRGFPREKREFHPHLTIGRVRKPSGVDLGPILQEHADEDLGSMQVDRLIFYRSTLQPSGAIHDPVWSVELARERSR